MGVFERSGKVWLDFRYKGVRCRESLKAPYNKANVKYAERLLGEIENKIEKDIFNYSDYFSDSKTENSIFLIFFKISFLVNCSIFIL